MSRELRATAPAQEHLPAVGSFAAPGEAEADSKARALSEFWYTVFAEGHPGLVPKRHLYALLPSDPRCKLCALPFGGIGPLFTQEGWCPSRRNPNYCAVCDKFVERMSPAETAVTLPVVFVDLCDSTKLSYERAGDFPALRRAFHADVSAALFDTEGFVLEKSGDAVVGVYPPGLSGLSRGGVSREGEPRRAREVLRDVLSWRGRPHSFPRHVLDLLPGLIESLGAHVRPGRTPEQALAFAAGLAVDCARRLVEVAAPRLWESHRAAFRTGVHVGRTVISIAGDETLGASLSVVLEGPLVPVAARLAHQAEPDEALVSDDVLRIAGRTLDGCERRAFAPDLTGGPAGSAGSAGSHGGAAGAAVGSTPVPVDVLRGVPRAVDAWVIRMSGPGAASRPA